METTERMTMDRMILFDKEVFSEYPDIPKLYRSDEFTDFKGKCEDVVVKEALDLSKYYDKQNPWDFIDGNGSTENHRTRLRIHRIFRGYTGNPPSSFVLSAPEVYDKKYIEDAFQEIKQSVGGGSPEKVRIIPLHRIHDGPRNEFHIAFVHDDDMVYINHRIREHRINEVSKVLEPYRSKHSPWVATFAKKLIDFSDKEGFYPTNVAKVIVPKSSIVTGIFKSPSPEGIMQNYGNLVSDWTRAKEQNMPIKEFAKRGYKLPHQQEIDR